jgi:8-oxo-dGTP pyrophosphatase MutT (NUDIX family)
MNHNYSKNNYCKYICNNCGVSGHLFYKCKKPIMSFGIICFRINKHTNKVEYLMLRRKDSLGYVDFLRGKFNQNNDFHLKNIIDEMTNNEIYNIIHYDYSYLWNKLWNKKNEKCDKKNVEKFNYVKKYKLELFKNNLNTWKEPEWGFPKGRRNNMENDFECSIREFEEETGYSSHDLIIIKNLSFFEEVFTGSNMKSYKHKYYLCKIDYDKTINEEHFQKSEIGALKWMDYETCLSKIRNYNYEKINLLNKINYLINK